MATLVLLLAVAASPGLAIPDRPVAAASTTAVDTSWMAGLEGGYRIVLEATATTSVGSFRLELAPSLPSVQDARLPRLDALTDERGELREALDPPVTLALHPYLPGTRHCLAAGAGTGEKGRRLRCPLATRAGSGLRAWFDRHRQEEIDRTVPHTGDVLRLRIERGDASSFTGSWEASFARATGAEERVVAGRFEARLVDGGAGGAAVRGGVPGLLGPGR